MNGTLEIFLLGQFRVSYDGDLISALNHARLQELLAYLLLNQDKPASRQQIAFLFWPNSNEEQSRTNLRNLLHRLRRAFPASADYLVIDDAHLQWRSDLPLSFDIAEFEEALLQAESASRSNQIELLAQAVRFYGGDLLPECYSDWLLAERERLRQSYLAALRNLAELYEDERVYPKAIQAVRALLRSDPLDENAYARLMRLYAVEGNRSQALHIYHTCAEVLSRELNVAPGPAVRSLYEQLIQTRAALEPAIQPVPLIARQAEWKQLTSRWRGLLRDQQPLRAILISGEAGIGKTHLAQFFVNWVQRQGTLTATAACYDGGRDLAYAPIATWLAGLFEQDERAFINLPPTWRIEISRLLPELHSHDLVLGTPGSLSEKWQLLHFYEALLQTFASVRSPLLLFLDDIQWCDQETLAWLAYLQSKPDAKKVVLIATARSEVLGGDRMVLQLFQKGDQDLFLELPPLDEPETRLLVEQLAGEAVDADLAQLVYQQSEGNPLFVTELMRFGLDQFVNENIPLPERVQSVIDWRLNLLSERARQIIELAAVIGRSFSYKLLEAASILDKHILVDSLDECWRQRILRERSDQDYDFSHDKLRQAAYDRLSQARRRLLHDQVAVAMELVYASNLELVAEQIAHHLKLAGQAGRAILFYERAAQASRQLHALPQAASLLEQALQLLEPNTTSDPLAARLHEQLAYVLLISGQYEASRQNLSIALQHLDQADTAARARLLRQTAQTWSSQQHYEQAEHAIQGALAETGNLPPGEQESDLRQEWLETRLHQVDCLYFQNRPDDMEAVLELLEDPLHQSGTLEQQASYYTLRGMLNNRRLRYGANSETVLVVRRALELALQINDPLLIARKHFGLGFNLLWHGDRQEAIAHLDLALSLAEKLGATFIQNQALAYLAIGYRMNSRKDRVSQLSQRGLALAEAENHPTYQGVALANLAWLAYWKGDLELAEQMAEKALLLWGHGAYPFEWLAYFPLAAVALQHGEFARAQERLAAILGPLQQRLPGELETRLYLAIRPNGEVNSPVTGEAVQQALNTASRLSYL